MNASKVNSRTDKKLSNWYENPETETHESPDVTAIRCPDPECDFYVASNDPETLELWEQTHFEGKAHRVVPER